MVSESIAHGDHKFGSQKMAEKSLPVQTLALHQPSLEELSSVLANGLNASFEEVFVKVVDCPNLEKEPFCLAAQGLCGDPKIIDVGGVKNLQPVPKKEKVYNLDKLAQLAQLPGAFLIGAGAGPHHRVGVNCEFIANAKSSTGSNPGKNLNYMAKIDAQGGSTLFQMPETNECALMLNALVCEGKPGKVLEIRAKRRLRETNFITAIREILKNVYGQKPVGIGGVFLIESGNAKLHVMPDFPQSTQLTDDVINDWLLFYEANAPLICLSVLVSHDPDLDLRVEHTHCFSQHGQGGHYHHDTTPRDVQYLGYFIPAQTLYRIDKP